MNSAFTHSVSVLGLLTPMARGACCSASCHGYVVLCCVVCLHQVDWLNEVERQLRPDVMPDLAPASVAALLGAITQVRAHGH